MTRYLALALLLAGCATAPPGADARGTELKGKAAPVLAALERYREDRGEYPVSLHELVPRYLDVVPFDVGLRLDRDRQVIEFAYSQPWPRLGHTICVARLGATEFSCHD